MLKNNKELYNVFLKLGHDINMFEFLEIQNGNTNKSYLAKYNDNKYIIRIATCNEIININRENEFNILNILQSETFLNYPLYFNKCNGNMISKFIVSNSVTDINAKLIQDVLLLFKKLHLYKCEIYFNPYNDIETRLEKIGISLDLKNDEFVFAYDLYNSVSLKYKYEKTKFLGLCHNDAYISNFIYSENENLYLVDYEFSGMGDIFFDYACFISSCDKENSNEFKEEFLKVAVKNYSQNLLNRLDDFIIIQLFWNYTWALSKAIFEKNDFYKKYANHFLNKIINMKK